MQATGAPANSNVQIPTACNNLKGRSSASRHSRSTLTRATCSASGQPIGEQQTTFCSDLLGFHPGSPASSSLLPSSEDWMAIEAAGALDGYLMADDEMQQTADWPLLHHSSSGIQGPMQQQAAGHTQQQKVLQQQQQLPGTTGGSSSNSPLASDGTTGMAAISNSGHLKQQRQQQQQQWPNHQHQQQQHQVPHLAVAQQPVVHHYRTAQHMPDNLPSSAKHMPHPSMYYGQPSEAGAVHSGAFVGSNGGFFNHQPDLPPHLPASRNGHGQSLEDTVSAAAAAAAMPGSSLPGNMPRAPPGHAAMGMPGEFCGDSSGVAIDPYMPGHRSDAGPMPVRYQLGVTRGPGYVPAVSAGPYTGHAYPGPAPPAPMPGAPYYHHAPGPHHGLHSLCGPGMHPASYPPEPPMPGFARPPAFCDIPGCLCGAGQPLPPHISAAPSHLGHYSVTTAGPLMQHDVYEAVPGRTASHHHLPQMPNMLEGSSSAGYSGLGGLGVAAVPPSIPAPGSGSMAPGPLAAAGLTPRHVKDPAAAAAGAGYDTCKNNGLAAAAGFMPAAGYPATEHHLPQSGMFGPNSLPHGMQLPTTAQLETAYFAAGTAPAMVADPGTGRNVTGTLSGQPGAMAGTGSSAVGLGQLQSLSAAPAAMTRVHSSPAQLLFGHHSSGLPNTAATPLAAKHALQQVQQQQQQQLATGVESSDWDAKAFSTHSMLHCSSEPCMHHQQTHEATSEIRTPGAAMTTGHAPAAAAIAVDTAAATRITAFDVECKVEAGGPVDTGVPVIPGPPDVLLPTTTTADAGAEAAATDYPLLTGFGSMYSATAPATATEAGSDDAGAGPYLQSADQTLVAIGADVAAAAAAAHAAEAELASLAAADPAAAAAVGLAAAPEEGRTGVLKAAATGSKKQSAKGRKGGVASGKGPGAASAMAVGKAGASGNKRKAEQPAAKGPKASKSSEGHHAATSDGTAAQPKVQRYIKDMMELRQQFNSLRTTNNQIKVQVLTLQLSKTELLSRLTDLTGKWRSTVADNVQLQQDNAALRDKIAKVKQHLAETAPTQQQQQGHETSSEPKHRLPWLSHCAAQSSERVPRAQSV